MLKGAATAAGKQDRRVGLGTGPKPKPITMPKMPWDDEKKEVDNQSSNLDSVGNKGE